jgi:GT2 family glycosyltransferase
VNPDLSVVICAHDTRRLGALEDAFQSVAEQLLQPREIVIVVDNNELLLGLVRKQLPDAIAVPNTHARGLGGARNSGTATSSGSVVAFLDDDAIASADWLTLLAAGYRDDCVAGVGGSIAPRWPAGRPRWFPAELDWLVGCTYTGMPETKADVRNLIGCNMSFRREVLEELGGFRLGYGCDETEFCIRLRQRRPDARLVYEPAARVLHQVSEPRTRLRHFLARCYFEGQSKAVVSRLVGESDGLSSERRYTRTVLPAALRREAGCAVRRRDVYGVLRGAAIVSALATTAAGYAAGRIRVEQAARVRGWEGELP